MRARVAQVLAHPAYRADTADFDVAVLRLRRPLALGRLVQPVCLPAAGHAFPPRSRCLISGWGSLREDVRKRPAPLSPPGPPSAPRTPSWSPPPRPVTRAPRAPARQGSRDPRGKARGERRPLGPAQPLWGPGPGRGAGPGPRPRRSVLWEPEAAES